MPPRSGPTTSATCSLNSFELPVGAWIREEWHGGAELLHARPMPRDGRRRVSCLLPTAPALILGSASPDPFGGGRPGLVRRRSGGGSVWLDPALSAWVDAFVPTGDAFWRSDVGQAFHWLGHTLAAAFSDLGVPAAMHSGPYEPGPSDGLVCFASLGPGEIVAAGRKLVGISQRRTREGCRFQCVAYERFELGLVESALDSATAAQIRERAVGWADLGIKHTPAEIAHHLVKFITAHDA